MAEIEHKIEGKPLVADYVGRTFTDNDIARGAHRNWVGRHWEDGHGQSQVDYLVSTGLRPEHLMVDIGCGSFRAGRYFVDYLEPGHYYGVDANRSVVQAGYDHELTAAQRGRLPIANLRANERFDTDFGVLFDYALAQSVFTHVSLNQVRLCLFRLAKVMRPGGKFYATFFPEPRRRDLDYIRPAGRAKQRSSECDVYWNYRSDFRWAATFSPWQVRYIGDWGHPAGQHMLEFTRLAAAVGPAPAPAAGAADRRLAARARRWAARRLAP